MMIDDLRQLEFCPFTTEYVAQILSWRYEPPYDIYNMSNMSNMDNMGKEVTDPNELSEAIEYFLQPEYHFQAVLRQPTAELVAFCSFGADGQVPGGDYSVTAVDIGMSVHPALTGRGLGRMFVGLAIDFAQKRFSPPRLRVTIADFNHRAQIVWQRHGFILVQEFRADNGKRPFIIYVRE